MRDSGTTIELALEGADRTAGLELSHRLRLVICRVQRRIRADERAPLPPLQLSTLVTLGAIRDLTVGALADVEGVGVPTMSRVVGSLVSRGLVSRRQDVDDSRRRTVRLSRSGEALLARIGMRDIAYLAEQVDRLHEEHRAALRAALPALEALVAGLQHPAEEPRTDR